MKNWPWYGYVLLAAIIFGLAYFLYFKPQQAEYARIKAERLQVENEVLQLQEKKKQLDKIEAEIAALTGQLQELQKIIPQKEEIDVILRMIQQMALDSRLDIIRFTPRGEVNRDFYAERPIPIEVTGNYHNLASFFDRLSKFERLFNIENFAIRALPNQTDDLTIAANFTAKTYIFLEEKANPPAKPGVKRRGL
jgi:type IV pilus assembly protein PilO